MPDKPRNLITIVFMGDSITEGQYVSFPNRWVDIISSDITRQYIQAAMNLVFVVRGVSGETTRQGLERFPKDVQEHHPDVVIIQFGLNDCNCWATDYGLPRVSEAAYRANLIEMITRARRFGAERIILSNNHTTLRQKQLLCDRTLEEQRKRYNVIVKEVAMETSVTFCDIDESFKDMSPAELENLLLPYPDWLHLSHEGHKIYARRIQPYIEAAIADVAKSRATSVKRSA